MEIFPFFCEKRSGISSMFIHYVMCLSTYQFLQIAKAVGDEEVGEGVLGGLGAGVAGGLDHPDLDPLVLLGVRLLGGLVGRFGISLETG